MRFSSYTNILYFLIHGLIGFYMMKSYGGDIRLTLLG